MEHKIAHGLNLAEFVFGTNYANYLTIWLLRQLEGAQF